MREASRPRTATLSPRLSSSLTIAPPTKPVPPATKIVPPLTAPQGLAGQLDAVGGCHVVLGVNNLAVLVDDEVAAEDAHELVAVTLALAPDAVSVGDRLVFVREQRERQAELIAERLVALDAVRAHAQDDGVVHF